MATPSGPSAGTGAYQLRREVLVKLVGGEELAGMVETFNAQGPSFYLRLHTDGASGPARQIPFDRVQSVAFVAVEPRASTPMTISPAARVVTVRLLDESLLRGVTESYGGARRGLFLVPTDGVEVERYYLPVGAIREVVSVQTLGDIMTERRMVTREMIEQALQRQQELREEPLGAILLREKRLSDEQLAKSLSLQRDRTGARIGEILIEQGFITQEEVARALVQQQRQRSKKIGEILIELGFASSKMVAIALSIQYNVPFVSLARQAPDPALRELVPSDFAVYWQVLPLRLEDNLLTIVVADPTDTSAKLELRRRTGLAVTEVVATPQEINDTLTQFYGR